MTYPSDGQHSQLSFDLSNARIVTHPAYNQRTKENNIGIFTIDGQRLPGMSKQTQDFRPHGPNKNKPNLIERHLIRPNLTYTQ